MATTDTGHRFGVFGGRYVPETLIPALDELDTAFDQAIRDPEFQRELDRLLKEYVGRPSPLSTAPRLSEKVGCDVYLKREDLNHTGAHKINSALGQALLARRMGAKVVPVLSGTRTLKDATSEAIRDWVTNVEDSYYIIGLVFGSAPDH